MRYAKCDIVILSCFLPFEALCNPYLNSVHKTPLHLIKYHDTHSEEDYHKAKTIGQHTPVEGAYTERELMLVKVRAVGKEREEMKRMADIFRGRVIDVTDKSYTIELTGDSSKNDAFLEAIDRSAILETVRTGACGIGRGERVLRV